MISQLSSLKILVRDSGQFISVAQRLARDVARVYYCGARPAEFPQMSDYLIGYGLDEIEVVESPWDVLDSVDLLVYPDLYFGAEQAQMVKLGKPVWGTRHGEDLELDRVLLKQILKAKGMPVSDYDVIVGMTKLRAFLKANPDVYVKMSKYRGSWESAHSEDYPTIEPMLDEVAHQLGAFKEIAEFICEAPIPDAVEVGYDGYSVDGQFPSLGLSGVECKDKGYVGAMKSYASLPKEVRDVNASLIDSMKETQFRSMFCTEIRIGRDGKPYLIDFTARMGSPPNQLQQELFTNFTDILWQGANGKLVDPTPQAKFGAQLILCSDFAGKNWQPVNFPDSIKDHVKLNNAVKIKGQNYVVPQSVELSQIGAVVGWGATMEAAIEQVKEISKEVTGYGITIPQEAFDDVEEEIEKSKSLGVSVL